MATGRSTTNSSGAYQAGMGQAKATLSVVDHPDLYHYSNDVSLRLTDVQKQHHEQVVTPHASAQMAGSLDEGQFLQWLATTVNAKTIVEVGVFVGSTTLALALSPTVEKIYALDITSQYPDQGRPYWQQAGVEQKIELQVGSAVDSMQQLIKQGVHADLIFIDADKLNYDQYYELGLQLVRQGGIIAIDNVFRHGDVLLPAGSNKMWDKEGTNVIQQLNKKIHGDERVDITILPLADGLTLCRKR